MNRSINRRDFLKLSSMVPFSLASSRLMKLLAPSASGPNVIVLIFDAFSAYNVPFYGYGRDTAPNLASRARRAVVYHNHFAASNFTSSGTASLLTGTLPWTNRAIEDNGTVADALVPHNIFNVLPGYFRSAFTHNSWVVTLLNQFHNDIEDLIPREKLYISAYDGFIHSFFYKDDDIADVAWTRDIKLQGGYAYSLFLSNLYKTLRDRETASLEADFPLGIPVNASSDGFLLEDSTSFLGNHLRVMPQPFFAYYHFLPPHAPYRTSLEFYKRFAEDKLKPVDKPLDPFGSQPTAKSELEQRRQYDEFILYADKAFGAFYDGLENAGLLENTWLIVTSDHGEMFERGLVGHGNATLYQPLVRVPLIIFEPGRQSGTDIHAITGAVDLLPTVAQITGHPVPDWTEGMVLPPYAAATPDPNRGTYAVQARKSRQYAPLTRATIMLAKGRYKLIYYFGYPEVGIQELVKLYDIEADPEELVDLSAAQPAVTASLLAELKSKLAQSNQPYQ
jgi:choline-sulfatase